MKTTLRLLFVFAVVLCCAVPVSSQDLDPEEVRAAIDQGIQFLRRSQQANGNWLESHGDEKCGATSLAVLAMVSCGVSKDDPTIKKAMNYLRAFSGKDAGRNYSISLQTMAFCLVSPEQDNMLIRENIKLIEQYQEKKGEHLGGWNYKPGGNGSDLSNSQFTILALYEAERVGVAIKKETWVRTLDYWERTQNKNGSWGYNPSGGANGGSSGERGSMTCAGIASLIVTSGVLGQGGAAVHGENIVCFQRPDLKSAEKIEKGLAWMSRGFSISQNPSSPGGNYFLLYYLYALERVGRMTNQRFIGEHDWYREGASYLLKQPLRDPIMGRWQGPQTGPIVSTSFALLFLSKGRRPVLMSKVEFGGDSSWNAHPNDVNNLTHYAEINWKLDLTWQVLHVDKASTEDLLQSPILYFCGSRSPLPVDPKARAQLAAKLRGYLDQGGFIIGEAQSNDRDFEVGFRELMRLVMPEPGYELRLLEQNHPIWSAEFPIEADQQRPIEGINFGCRTSVIFVPRTKDGKDILKFRPSLSCLWEVAQVFRRTEKYPAVVQRQVDAGLGIGLNILAYATNRELKFKDQVAEAVGKRLTEATERRGRIFLGLLQHGGGANAAPHALPNLLQWSALHLGVPVDIRTDLVEPASPELLDHPIVFIHGRGAFKFTDEQRTNIKRFIENGGFLFGSAICSAKAFIDSFNAEMKQMFPDRPLEPIKIDDKLFSDDYGGYKIQKLQLRLPEQAPGRKMVVAERAVEPELTGIRFDNRLGVVFSPHDVSCALEMANTLECKGYTRESALELAVNVLLYALEHR